MGRNDRGFDPQDLDNYITGHYGEDQYRDEPEPDIEEPDDAEPGPITYKCLSCGRIIERDEGEELPPGDEHCSHEWEAPF